MEKEDKAWSPRYYHKTAALPVADAKDSKAGYDNRRMSLLETMLLSTTSGDAHEFNPGSTQLTVGDIVRVRLHGKVKWPEFPF